MKNTIYAFVLSLLIGFSSLAFAAVGPFFGETMEECQDLLCPAGTYKSSNGWSSGLSSSSWPDYSYQTGVTCRAVATGAYVQDSFCYVRRDACPAGTVLNHETGECDAPCKSGDPGVGSKYFGIAPSAGYTLPPGSYPSLVCDGQCQIVPSNVENCYSSADKPYPKPVWCDFSGVKNGQQCSYSPSTDPAPNDDSGVCPGGVCPTPTCANGATDYPTCTPSTCSNGATNYPECTAGTCSNGATDWPTCTTPQTGTCNNGATNYPACTTGGSGSGSGGGSGTCANGASNYPTCTTPQGGSGGNTNTKIDESGTPTGVNSDGSAALDTGANDRITGFNDNTKVADIPWSFQFSLPATACSPISWSVFGRVQSIDLCPALERVRTALAYLWYGLACIYCWKRVTGATGASA